MKRACKYLTTRLIAMVTCEFHTYRTKLNKYRMKNIVKSALLLLIGAAFVACSDFDELNVNPKAASVEQVQVEYILNNAIIGPQQDPHVAERVFVLYWKTAARHHLTTTIAAGSYNDGWTGDYYSYLSGWLKSANLAVTVAQDKIDKDVAMPYTNNLLQFARIWRVYLMSEFADNFGPMPIDAFKGENPTFSNLKDVYYHLLSELADATAKIDLTAPAIPASNTKYDQAFGFDYTKWLKYGNSLRLRLAMRLSEVDPAKAKAEFEAAASKALITTTADIFKVAERPGWDALTGVMSREWNSQILSATLNNLYIGIGGINTSDVVSSDMHAKIKPQNYMGIKYDKHFPSKTNDPSTGFWVDGLHAKMDPRAYKAFIAPGDFNNPDFSFYPSWDQSSRTVKRKLLNADGSDFVEIDATYSWNAYTVGNWGPIGSMNQVRSFTGTMPRLSQQFRGSQSQRVFFADWETYFLLAEAALKGWNVGTTAKAAYENGVRASMAYWGLSAHADAYLASENYNRAGTSAKFDHTAEPPASVIMSYIDGYTGLPGIHTYSYPKNTIYKNGTVNNDQLTKIITQKYIAQVPWLPLEAWNDHRRLGLPFFENIAVEQPNTDMPDLTTSNYMTNSIKFFPQRLKYPSSLENTNPDGYADAVNFLGGPDAVLTPLWWAKKQ
jgi:hypothetical protein